MQKSLFFIILFLFSNNFWAMNSTEDVNSDSSLYEHTTHYQSDAIRPNPAPAQLEATAINLRTTLINSDINFELSSNNYPGSSYEEEESERTRALQIERLRSERILAEGRRQLALLQHSSNDDANILDEEEVAPLPLLGCNCERFVGGCVYTGLCVGAIMVTATLTYWLGLVSK